MKKILMISYYYPPLNDVGGLRALGFSKYLLRFGWKPYILTVANPDKAYCSLGNIRSPEEIEVFRSHSIVNLSRIMGKLNGCLARILRLFHKELRTNVFVNLLCIPDIFVGWIPLTFLKGLQIIRRHSIDAIYVSCKPFSSSLIALLLKRVSKKPVIMDLRDPFIVSLSNDESLSCRLNRIVNRLIEKYVFKSVDKLILVTDKTRHNYLSLYPFLESKSHRIYNGFLPADAPLGCEQPYDHFTIVYVGDYYVSYEDSELLFRALRHIRIGYASLGRNIRFFYCGGDYSWMSKMMNQYELWDAMLVMKPVSREESIRALFRSSVIYLRIVKDMISTKLFEGLMTGRPFLVATHNDEVRSLIQRYSPSSEIVEPKDMSGLANSIMKLYKSWSTGALESRPSQEYLGHFNKIALTRHFSEVLKEL